MFAYYARLNYVPCLLHQAGDDLIKASLAHRIVPNIAVDPQHVCHVWLVLPIHAKAKMRRRAPLIPYDIQDTAIDSAFSVGTDRKKEETC